MLTKRERYGPVQMYKDGLIIFLDKDTIEWKEEEHQHSIKIDKLSIRISASPSWLRKTSGDGSIISFYRHTLYLCQTKPLSIIYTNFYNG